MGARGVRGVGAVMKIVISMTLLAIAIGMIVAGLVLSLINARYIPQFHEWDVAEAYACGYTSALEDKVGKPRLKFCMKWQEIAAKHGYHDGRSKK